MKKDNRIVRPELMTEKDRKVMDEAIDSFYEKHYGDKETELKPYEVVVDGKKYDTRYTGKQTPQSRYDAANTVQIKMKLNKKLDSDILEQLEKVGNKQGYIKALIRADIKKN